MERIIYVDLDDTETMCDLMCGSVEEDYDDFAVGDYIVYVNGDQYELGRIKSLCDDGAFVAYHEGETGAKTPYDLMHKLINSYTIQDTSLGGDYFK